MENNIAALCEQLQAAREAKKNLKAKMEELDGLISQLKDDVTLALTEQGLDQCVTGGYTYTVYKSYRVEKTCEPKALVNLVRLYHQDDLITEYVNTNKLKSFVAKELKTNDELPSWLLGSVHVEEASQLSIKKSKKTGDGEATGEEAAEEEPIEEELTEEEAEQPEFVKSCDNCQLRKSERCTQVRNEICVDYRFIPFSSQEEKENRPLYGDATAFRLGEKRR